MLSCSTKGVLTQKNSTEICSVGRCIIYCEIVGARNTKGNLLKILRISEDQFRRPIIFDRIKPQRRKSYVS